MDPLSEVLTLIKPQVFFSGGFAVRGDLAIHFPQHKGIKCYAQLSGQCWLVIDNSAPIQLNAGDCFLLPRGLPFTLTTNLALEPVPYTIARDLMAMCSEAPGETPNVPYMAGGHFGLSGGPAEMLLQSLPPIVHIQHEADKAAMRSSIERMRDELSNPQPGSALLTQHLAYTLLIQALRLHLTNAANTAPGWLSALSDHHMRQAITSMHSAPGHPWTLQSLAESVGMSRSVFALRFREKVGSAPMEYLARWRMHLAADRLKNSTDSLCTIAESLGYESESAFGKAFRRIMGCSPRQYTKRHG